MHKVIKKQNILDKSIYLGRNFSKPIHSQCYNMSNKIRAKVIIRVKITMASFANRNRNVKVNNNKMLSLCTDSYSNLVIKILKENH